MRQQKAVQPPEIEISSPKTWSAAAALGISAAAFLVYYLTLAPGLTWAHQGADGGELIAAAVVNGVPHPPGYPLYMLLLGLWLNLGRLLLPSADLNWLGALLSAACAAGSAGVTFLTARHLLRDTAHAPLWAALGALAWAISPLLWMQAVIAEVYALHSLLLALLGWAVLVHPDRPWYVVAPVALGVANHLTSVLLLPAAAYALWAQSRTPGDTSLRTAPRSSPRSYLPASLRGLAFLALGLLIGALFYLRTPLVAAAAPPVNWGYADNWDGFWWLVSGAAYRGYLFSSPADSWLTRLAGWAYTVTAQYTPIGLALALVGLAHWDRVTPWLRNFSLLWLGPISLYAIAYYTRDSDIYLLPVGWLMALWLSVGLAQVAAWLTGRFGGSARPQGTRSSTLLGGVVAVSLIALGAWRWGGISLADDREARDYLQGVQAVLEPNSIVVTLDDKATFALWYGAWGSGELFAAVEGVTPVNESLYQFDWYRRLQGDLHPDIEGIDESVDAILAANRGERPIFFAQLPTYVAQTDLIQTGPLWRYRD
jgi:hypothetical protein